MPPRLRTLTAVLLALAALCPAAPARADVAPAFGNPGGALTPLSVTAVEMVSETVLLELAQLSFTAGPDEIPMENTRLGAKVTAEFHFRNAGSAPEHLTVAFPLYSALTPDNYADFRNIVNFRAFVNETEVTALRSTMNGEAWMAWEMDFVPGDTALRVTYDSPATADACSAEFGYVLHTGAGWAGTIGQADIRIRFGYPAESLLVGDGKLYLKPAPDNFAVQDFELVWHYEDLEPTEADDFSATVVNPECWREVARQRAALLQDASAENYWQMAKAFADIVFPHHGFESKAMAQTANELYLHAIELDPGNAELRSEFAAFIEVHTGGLLPTEAALVLTEIAPTYRPAATRTASPFPTPPEAPTGVPSITPAPQGQAQPTPAPTSTPAARATSGPAPGQPPACGGALVLGLLAVGPALIRRRRAS